MPDQQPSLTEWLEAKKKLEDKLEAAGVVYEEYGELWALLDVVTGADLESIRAKQFEQDARDLCIDIKASSEKNVARVSDFLRKFAVHLVGQVIPDQGKGKLEERVDTLVALSSGIE
jgi:hypothetical protein